MLRAQLRSVPASMIDPALDDDASTITSRHLGRRPAGTGVRLGRYLVLQHLASGGMADVLLGRTDGIAGFERHVVLKRIRREHARNERFIRMLLDEAQIAASLHHHNIVQVHDIDEVAGDYFIAMEYIHGENLRTMLEQVAQRGTQMPIEHAIAIVSAVAAGLHYAHERRSHDDLPLGIVHRDVSLSNVVVGYDGCVKIVDFGIAKARWSASEAQSRTVVGKVGYMSPEQCTGAPLDRRSDVYSLGVVFYELVTAMRLFSNGTDRALMKQIIAGRVVPPEQRRPDLPLELSSIILRALSPDPELRFQTAEEMRLALEHFAMRRGRMAQTSDLARYVRQLFGDKREPWFCAPSELLVEDVTVPPAPVAIAHDHRRAVATEPRLPPAGRSRAATLARIVPPALVIAAIAVWQLGYAHRSAAETMPRVDPLGATQVAAAPITAPMPATAPVADTSTDRAASTVDRTTATIDPAVLAIPAAGRRSTPDRRATVPARPVAARSTPAASRTTPTALPDPTALVPTAPSLAAAPAPVEVRSLVHLDELRVAPPAPPAPPSVASAPQVIPGSVLEANRIAGSREITPDDLTKTAIGRSGSDKIVSSYQVCVTADGAVASVTPRTSSGFDAYDAKIASTIKSEWKYRRIVLGGKATPACALLTFMYVQH